MSLCYTQYEVVDAISNIILHKSLFHSTTGRKASLYTNIYTNIYTFIIHKYKDISTNELHSI